MIGYVTLGTNDLARAAKFYDAIAEELGVKRILEADDGRYIAWGPPDGSGGLSLMRPFDGNRATVGNGVMVALPASNNAQVDRLHQIALDQGGTDEGKPGYRENEPYYVCYFRDLDGNKLNAIALEELKP